MILPADMPDIETADMSAMITAFETLKPKALRARHKVVKQATPL